MEKGNAEGNRLLSQNILMSKELKEKAEKQEESDGDSLLIQGKWFKDENQG